MKTTKRKSKSVQKSPARAAKPAATAPSERVLTLSSHCTIKDAAALKQELCAIANEPGEVTLDVGSIERIDTPSMQLLCAFARDRAQRNQKVAWKGESQSWQEAVRLLGTSALLGLSANEGAQR